MAEIVSTTVSEDIKTQYALSVKQIFPQVVDNIQDTMPTLRILKQNKQDVTVSPDENWFVNMITKMQDSYGMPKNAVFDYAHKDPYRQQKWDFHKFNSSAGMNDFDMEHYGNSQVSLADLANTNMKMIRAALTWRANWDLWSDWSDITATSLTIDLNTTLGALGHRNPPDTILKYLSTTDRPFGIPTLIRYHEPNDTYPYVLGNIDSRNRYWRSMVEFASGFTPTYNTTGDAIGVITNDHPVGQNLVEISREAVQDFLSRFQRGPAYQLVCCCPIAIYNYFKNFLMQERRQSARELNMQADLGIDSAVTFNEFNCVFYTDPLADILYPNTLWFFDPSVIIMTMDDKFNPKTVSWEAISGTNQMGTVTYYNMNNIIIDPVGAGAMVGWKAPA